MLVTLIVAVALLLAGGGYGAAKLTFLKDVNPGSAPTQVSAGVQATPTSIPPRSSGASPAASPAAVAVPATPTPAPTPTALTAVEAAVELEALVAEDAARPSVRGQWVAQLSSKSEGIVDKTLQAEPFTLADIISEHLRLRSDPSYGSLVRLLHLGDWGSRRASASPMWVTVADIDAGSSAEVTTWCEAQFSQRGTALNNVCMASHLTPKSG